MKKALFRGRTPMDRHGGVRREGMGNKETGEFYYFSVLSICLHFLTIVSKFQELNPRPWRNVQPHFDETYSLIHKHTCPYVQLQLCGAPN